MGPSTCACVLSVFLLFLSHCHCHCRSLRPVIIVHSLALYASGSPDFALFAVSLTVDCGDRVGRRTNFDNLDHIMEFDTY